MEKRKPIVPKSTDCVLGVNPAMCGSARRIALFGNHCRQIGGEPLPTSAIAYCITRYLSSRLFPDGNGIAYCEMPKEARKRRWHLVSALYADSWAFPDQPECSRMLVIPVDNQTSRTLQNISFPTWKHIASTHSKPLAT